MPSRAASSMAFDVVVVGGGVMGSWTAARAAARGAKVCLLDQYDAAHSRGSSHGDGRIYRMAYEEVPRRHAAGGGRRGGD